MKKKLKRANLSDGQIASAQLGRAPTLFKRQDSTRTRQFYCNMSDKEVDECAQWPEITEEELSFAENLWNRDSSPDEQRLDDWL